MYQAIYKCRLCGEVFCYEESKAEQYTDFKITNILARQEPIARTLDPYRIDVHKFHKCKDNSFGFADLQGFKKMED